MLICWNAEGVRAKRKVGDPCSNLWDGFECSDPDLMDAFNVTASFSASQNSTSNHGCSAEPCGSSYHGIPKLPCIDLGCCWVAAASKCM